MLALFQRYSAKLEDYKTQDIEILKKHLFVPVLGECDLFIPFSSLFISKYLPWIRGKNGKRMVCFVATAEGGYLMIG